MTKGRWLHMCRAGPGWSLQPRGPSWAQSCHEAQWDNDQGAVATHVQGCPRLVAAAAGAILGAVVP